MTERIRVAVTVSVTGWGEECRITKVQHVEPKWVSSASSGGYQRPDNEDVRKAIEAASREATVSTMGALDPEYRPAWY